MGRASRRAQERADRRQKRQQTAPARSSVSAPAVTDGGARGSLLRPRWLLDILSELRKVTWPTRQETAHLTLVVIIVSILFGIVLGGADLGFSWLIENTILR
jgi:preprotein translocase subunit SecE